MAQFLKYGRPRGSVHDLAHALSLKDVGSNWLCVSDATLYVLQNWTALDLTFKSRWADELKEHGYYPIDSASANYGDWVDLVEQIQAEVYDLSCDIAPILEEIRDNIAAQTTKLDEIKAEITDLVTAEQADDSLIDQIEPLLDGIGVVMGAPELLGG